MNPMGTPRPLIIGYGNTLREDDGIGWRAAELLQQKLRPGAADIVQCHQLVPELAAEVEAASVVIFLDAAVDQEPGAVLVAPVEKQEFSPWSHRLSAGQVLQFANNAPPAYLIRGGALRTGWRGGLTVPGEQAAARMAEAVIRLLREQAWTERTCDAAAPATGATLPARRP